MTMYEQQETIVILVFSTDSGFFDQSSGTIFFLPMRMMPEVRS